MSACGSLHNSVSAYQDIEIVEMAVLLSLPNVIKQQRGSSILGHSDTKTYY